MHILTRGRFVSFQTRNKIGSFRTNNGKRSNASIVLPTNDIQRRAKTKVAHRPSFDCQCFVCELIYWLFKLSAKFALQPEFHYRQAHLHTLFEYCKQKQTKNQNVSCKCLRAIKFTLNLWLGKKLKQTMEKTPVFGLVF